MYNTLADAQIAELLEINRIDSERAEMWIEELQFKNSLLQQELSDYRTYLEEADEEIQLIQKNYTTAVKMIEEACGEINHLDGVVSELEDLVCDLATYKQDDLI